MEQTAFAALERYGVLGVVTALLIAAFIWYQRTQDKFRDEERGGNVGLRAEVRELRDEIRQLRQEIHDIETREDEWKKKYYQLLNDRHPRHEEGHVDDTAGT